MRTNRFVRWMLVGAGVLGMPGCASRSTARESAPNAREPANVQIHLANESSAHRSVGLEIYVDGKLAVRRRVASLATANGYRDREMLPLHLSPGSHAIRVVVEGRTASTTAEVVATSRMTYVSVEYWYEPGSPGERTVPERVEVLVQDRPFGFC